MNKNDKFFLSGNPQAVKPPVPKPRRCGLDELANDDAELLELITYAEWSIRLTLNGLRRELVGKLVRRREVEQR